MVIFGESSGARTFARPAPSFADPCAEEAALDGNETRLERSSTRSCHLHEHLERGSVRSCYVHERLVPATYRSRIIEARIRRNFGSRTR